MSLLWLRTLHDKTLYLLLVTYIHPMLSTNPVSSCDTADTSVNSQQFWRCFSIIINTLFGLLTFDWLGNK